MGNEKIKNFTDLNAWQEAHALVLIIYKISKNFPREEMFGLTNQMRRAVISITSNIAEGFSRQSDKEKIQFYCTALGSLTEIQSQLFIAKDVKYIKDNDFVKMEEQAIVVHKLINGLIKSTRLRFHTS